MQKKLGLLHQRFLIPEGLLCIFLSIPVIAFSQTDTTKRLKEVRIETSSVPQVQSLVPLQQISAAAFDRIGAVTVADAIRNFSGVILKDYGGIGGLKTISVRGLSANHTSILLDGIQISDTENGQVDLGRLNLNNVSEITLYIGQPPVICLPARSFASSSILSIKTTQPKLPDDKSYLIIAGIKGGSFGLFNPYLQWQQRINRRWAFILNSYIENADGLYKYKAAGDGTDSLRQRTNAAIQAQQLDGALYYTRSDSNNFSFRFNYYHSDRGLPGAVILYNTASSNQRLWNSDSFMQSHYERLFKSRFHLLLNAKLSQNYLRYLDPDFLNAQHVLDQRFTQREAYFSVALAYHLTKNWEVSYASDVSVNDLSTNLFNFSYPTRLTLLNVLASNLDLGRVRIQGSLLNTNVGETVRTGRAAPKRNDLSPTLMATWQPLASVNFQLRAFYKSIFRNPTFNDLYYGGIGNPNLKPEYTRQFDAGATYSKALAGFLNYITLTTDAYYNKVTNKIIFLPKDAYNGSIQNFGKVDIKGLDVGLKTQATLASDFTASLSVNYSYQQSLNVTDASSSVYLNQLPYTPKNTLAVNAGIDRGPLSIYYNQIITSSRYYTSDNLPADLIPGYATNDITANYRLLITGKKASLSFDVNNLYNRNYYIIQSYPMPGRSYRISIQITI